MIKMKKKPEKLRRELIINWLPFRPKIDLCARQTRRRRDSGLRPWIRVPHVAAFEGSSFEIKLIKLLLRCQTAASFFSFFFFFPPRLCCSNSAESNSESSPLPRGLLCYVRFTCIADISPFNWSEAKPINHHHDNTKHRSSFRWGSQKKCRKHACATERQTGWRLQKQ